MKTRRDFVFHATALAGGLLAGTSRGEEKKNGGIFSAPNHREKPRYIAHRGSTSLAPENSMAAFGESAKRNFWAIETDVKVTKDGKLVCFHDASLERMLGVKRLVGELTFEELAKLPFVSGKGLGDHPDSKLRVPLFTDYLDICETSGCVPFIEIKDDVTDEVVRLLRDRKQLDRSVISSSHFGHLVAARKASKEVFIHHIFSDEDHMKQLVKMGYAGLSHKRAELDAVAEERVAKAHQAGLRICFRAGDTKESVLRMLEMGLDYIPTNEIVIL
jgi:glycerophosphoryl diester phosphodiesterase